MRRIAIGLCGLFVAASTPESLRAGAREQLLFSQEKPPSRPLFKTPAPPAVPAPKNGNDAVRPAFQREIRSLESRVVCGIKVIEGDPNVDRKIVIPIPAAGQNAKIRVITPPPCEEPVPGRR